MQLFGPFVVVAVAVFGGCDDDGHAPAVECILFPLFSLLLLR